jgi:hypothetical protein
MTLHIEPNQVIEVPGARYSYRATDVDGYYWEVVVLNDDISVLDEPRIMEGKAAACHEIYNLMKAYDDTP